MAAKKKTKRISVAEAAQKASDHLKALLPAAYDISVEETELDFEQQNWSITLSYFISDFIGREFKMFKVDAHSGEVLSMKIRGR